jgi:hypothetical protein
MKTKNSAIITISTFCILSCLAGRVYGADVTIANQARDTFFTKVSKAEAVVTPERVRGYAQQKLSQCLTQAGLQSDVTAAFEFSVGLAGKMLKDPLKDPQGSLLEIGGTIELPFPRVKTDFSVAGHGQDMFATAFSGGNVNGSSDWEGVQRVIDMSVGDLLKEFAKRGTQATNIVAILTNERPRLAPVRPASRRTTCGSLLSCLLMRQ